MGKVGEDAVAAVVAMLLSVGRVGVTAGFTDSDCGSVAAARVCCFCAEVVPLVNTIANNAIAQTITRGVAIRK